MIVQSSSTRLAPKRNTPPERKDSSSSRAAASVLRNLEKDLAAFRNSRDAGEARYGRNPLHNFTRISYDESPAAAAAGSSSRNSSLKALEEGELDRPRSQTRASSASSYDEYENDENVRSSSRLSNSAACSSSGTASLSQSLTDLHLRSPSGYARPQEGRSGRSSSLGRGEVRVAGLVGLMNEGNTCYLNSCLQCMAHTVPLSTAVLGQFAETIQSKGLSSRSRRDSSSMSEALAYAFRQVVKDLCDKPSYSVASASSLLQSLQCLAPQFGGGRQHDAQEVMRTIIDGLHEALNRKPPGRPKCPDPPPTVPEAEIADLCWQHHKTWNNSIIQDIFCGQLQSTIECSVCQRKSHCFDPFLDLSLPLPKHGSSYDGLRSYSSNSRSRVTIEECLSAFVAPETLDTSNKYYCSSCKAPQISTKKLSIYRAPSILVLHIKRFYGVEPRSYKKDDRAVHYPLNGLDLSSFMSGTARRALSQQTTYDLYAVCTHFGSLGYGHYTATCKSMDNGWYCYNDSSVSGVQDPIDSSAYILFYQQRA